MYKHVRTVAHAALNPRSVAGIIFVALAGGPTWNVTIEGKPVSGAWHDFAANVALFVNSPFVRILFAALAVWLLLRGAQEAIRAADTRAAKAKVEAEKRAEDQTQAAAALSQQVRQDIADAVRPHALYAKAFVLLEVARDYRASLFEVQNALLNYEASLRAAKDGDARFSARSAGRYLQDELDRLVQCVSSALRKTGKEWQPQFTIPPAKLKTIEPGHILFLADENAELFLGHHHALQAAQQALADFEKAVQQAEQEAEAARVAAVQEVNRIYGQQL